MRSATYLNLFQLVSYKKRTRLQKTQKHSIKNKAATWENQQLEFKNNRSTQKKQIHATWDQIWNSPTPNRISQKQKRNFEMNRNIAGSKTGFPQLQINVGLHGVFKNDGQQAIFMNLKSFPTNLIQRQGLRKHCFAAWI